VQVVIYYKIVKIAIYLYICGSTPVRWSWMRTQLNNKNKLKIKPLPPWRRRWFRILFKKKYYIYNMTATTILPILLNFMVSEITKGNTHIWPGVCVRGGGREKKQNRNNNIPIKTERNAYTIIPRAAAVPYKKYYSVLMRSVEPQRHR
jgi:hypothetical protein